MPRPKQRTPELRAAILEAALERLETGGLSALTARGVAARAGTSPPAIYELFGDKQGLIRALFYAGFRRLGQAYDALPRGTDPKQELLALASVFRAFALAHPALVSLMFGRPVSDFAPEPGDRDAAVHARQHIVGRMREAVESGALTGDPTDLSHAYLALLQGLALQEAAGWLGSADSVERRWNVAVERMLA